MNFVIIDLDLKRSPAQEELVKKYYQGYIPHVAVLDKAGNAVYDAAGEVEEGRIAALLARARKQYLDDLKKKSAWLRVTRQLEQAGLKGGLRLAGKAANKLAHALARQPSTTRFTWVD